MTGDELKSIALKHRTVIAGYEFADKFDFDAIAAELAESDARVAAAYIIAAARLKYYGHSANLVDEIRALTPADADRQLQIVVARAVLAEAEWWDTVVTAATGVTKESERLICIRDDLDRLERERDEANK